MYQRDVNVLQDGNTNTRRAFRDVTNANRSNVNRNKNNDDHSVFNKRQLVSTRHNHRTDSVHVQDIAPRDHIQEERNFIVDENEIAASIQPIQSIQSGFPLQRQGSSTISQSALSQQGGSYAPLSYQHSGQVDDIDERDANDPLCATEYVQDMYGHFRLKETTTSVRPIFMEHQSQINERMRSILVDWLVEVHLKFKLVPETLYLTVNIIDRYLDRTEVSRPKLQLVGVTALLIGSKYEEIYPPELHDLVYICDHAYRREQILEMEEKVLKTLEYQITIPSAHAFLVRYLKAAHADRRIVQLSCYILDGTLQSYNLLHYLPSQLAAAAVLIARRVVGRNAWSPTLLRYASYCEEEVIPVARAVLAEKSSASPELRAVNKKYSSSRYGGVANMSIDCDF